MPLPSTVLLAAALMLPSAGATGATASPGQRSLASDTLEADLALVQAAQEARIMGAGGDSAAVTIFEFFDYACSTCQHFHVQRGDSLRALAGPDVTIRLHTYIIPRLVRGYQAAEAATCAAGIGGQSAYLAYHDRLLRDPEAWRRGGADPALFTAWAEELGLDAARFADCVARDVPSMLLFSDVQLAARFGVAGTPTFVFLPRGAQSVSDAVVFYGNEPMDRFRAALAEARSRAR